MAAAGAAAGAAGGRGSVFGTVLLVLFLVGLGGSSVSDGTRDGATRGSRRRSNARGPRARARPAQVAIDGPAQPDDAHAQLRQRRGRTALLHHVNGAQAPLAMSDSATPTLLADGCDTLCTTGHVKPGVTRSTR